LAHPRRAHTFVLNTACSQTPKLDDMRRGHPTLSLLAVTIKVHRGVKLSKAALLWHCDRGFIRWAPWPLHSLAAVKLQGGMRVVQWLR